MAMLPLLLATMVLSCKKDQQEEIPVEGTGKLILNFYHCYDTLPLQFDTLMYANAAGNPYMVNEVRYFISRLTLHKSGGQEVTVDDWKVIHYVDTDIPSTWTWEIYDKLPAGAYDSLSFIFGLPEDLNQSFMYVNPPESNMFWPDYLGGGYHYLMFNGKWLEPGQTTVTTPFNMHLGRGQIYYSYPDSIIGFVPNFFRVSLAGSSFTLLEDQTLEVDLEMNVESWLEGPHVFDFNVYGGYIMQNQDAMQLVKENGHDVFSIRVIR
jgi:hypothetical protein